MWFLTIYSTLKFKLNRFVQPALIFYSYNFYYILNPWAYKVYKNFYYIPKPSLFLIRSLTLEYHNIKFKYLGKAYRISKKKKILVLNLHYPTFKYIVWNNIKLIFKKKKKKNFKFKLLNNNLNKKNWFFNLFKLRIPDTYTGRGILNNIYAHNIRKQKTITHR